MYFFLCYIFPFLSPPHRIDYILKCIIFFLFGAGSRWGRSHRLLFISFYLFLPTTSVFALTRPRVQPLFTSRCRKSPSRQTTISRCDANHHEIALWRMDETRPARWNEMTRLLTSFFFSLNGEEETHSVFFCARGKIIALKVGGLGAREMAISTEAQSSSSSNGHGPAVQSYFTFFSPKQIRRYRRDGSSQSHFLNSPFFSKHLKCA